MSKQLTPEEAKDLAVYREFSKLKATTPGLAHHMIANIGYGAIARGRELAEVLDSAAVKAEQDAALDQRAHILAAQLLVKPPQGGAPPTTAPAA